MIVDAHLDLAYNAANGRDPRLPARQQAALPYGVASVGLPDLLAGNVGLICATIFAQPVTEHAPHGYRNSEEAHQQAISQLRWYQQCSQDGVLHLINSRLEIARLKGTPSAIILMEGADPIRSLSDVKTFFDAGVRIVGLAWKRTRYAGGTGAPGPLTSDGLELVRELDGLEIIHDASHLAEESFWNLLEATIGPVIASHSNCRAIVPGDRHLSDEMIRAIAARDGVVGINLFDKFLLPPGEHGKRRAALSDVVRHIQHACDVVGDAKHVGIGTDMDGGLGRDQIPMEIQTSADLPRLGDALATAAFADRDVEGIMGGNWLRYFGTHLPANNAVP